MHTWVYTFFNRNIYCSDHASLSLESAIYGFWSRRRFDSWEPPTMACTIYPIYDARLILHQTGVIDLFLDIGSPPPFPSSSPSSRPSFSLYSEWTVDLSAANSMISMSDFFFIYCYSTSILKVASYPYYWRKSGAGAIGARNYFISFSIIPAGIVSNFAPTSDHHSEKYFKPHGRKCIWRFWSAEWEGEFVKDGQNGLMMQYMKGSYFVCLFLPEFRLFSKKKK